MEDFFFTGPLDYLLFEGEIAHGSVKPPVQVIKRKPSDVPGQTTWTGFGFMQVFEGSTLTFRIPEIYRTMNYFPVIRYEQDPANPLDWQTVDVELLSPDGPPGENSACAGAPEVKQTLSLPEGEKSVELRSSFCLEQSRSYEIKLTFTQYDPSQPQGAKILIDSVSDSRPSSDPTLNPLLCSRLLSSRTWTTSHSSVPTPMFKLAQLKVADPQLQWMTVSWLTTPQKKRMTAPALAPDLW